MTRVLVVEDSATASQMISSALAGLSAEIIHAGSGPEALSIAEEHDPDCILLDVELPGGMSGFEICAAVKERMGESMPPVLFITAREDGGDKLRGLALGALDFIPKPFEETELVARVKSALRVRSLQRELAAAHAEIDRLSRTDPITGSLNHRHLAEVLEQACSVSDRYGRPLGVVLGDLDNLRVINDQRGFSRGDRALEEFASIIHAASRDADTVGRFGSGEFLMICPETGVAGTAVLAGRIRASVEAAIGAAIGTDAVTASFGCAEKAPGETPDQLLGRASAALETAKLGGKNRVCLAPRAGGRD